MKELKAEHVTPRAGRPGLPLITRRLSMRMHREAPVPRKPCFNLADMSLHVIQRGNNRSACFVADQDYQFYLQCLKEAGKKYGVDVHAYKGFKLRVKTDIMDLDERCFYSDPINC